MSSNQHRLQQSKLITSWLRANFTRYQLKWISEPSKFSVAVKSRQIGFSDAEAGDSVLSGCIFKRPQLILSASQDLADEVLDKARVHCRTLAAIGVHQAVDFRVDNATEIAWRTGGRIVALPANPRTARSFSGDIHLDEYAYHADPEGIRDGAFPMASRGGWRVRILSTPNGAQGLFYDWVMNPPKGWAVHRVTVDDAIADGFPVDMEKLWSLCGGDERLFAQWYRCRFVDADLQYIPTAMVDGAVNWQGRVPDIQQADIFAGLDVGRTNDLTALVVVALVNDIAYTMPVITCKRTNFRAQREIVRQARDMFQWSTLHVDQTGIGAEMAEELAEEFGDEVRPVTFTAAAKEDLATRALRWFRDGRIRFPKDAEQARQLHAETISLRRQVTSSGNVVYDTPRTQQGHGDRFWALALALKGAGEPIAPRGMGQSPLLAVA